MSERVVEHANGVYHLFCQHYPDDVKWDPMHWSHAVSHDLVHWTEAAIALAPDGLGECFSGSAAVDWQNTSRLGRNGIPPLLAFYTAAGSRLSPRMPDTQCVAFSNDEGLTWQKYDSNPVLSQVVVGYRDPKVFWYEPTKRWIMVLYLNGSTFALFGSSDARTWTELSRFEVQGQESDPIPIE